MKASLKDIFLFKKFRKKFKSSFFQHKFSKGTTSFHIDKIFMKENELKPKAIPNQQ